MSRISRLAMLSLRKVASELPRSWFEERGYTDDEYARYKNFGYTLDPVEREQEIQDEIKMDRRMRGIPSTTTRTIPNGTSTTTQNGSYNYRYGRQQLQNQPTSNVEYRKADTTVKDTNGGVFR